MTEERNPMMHFARRPSRLRRRRRRTEGMTLVEIMIVVVIMALIATAVGVAVIPRWRQAQVDSTRTDAQSIRSAVQLYMMDTNECPTSGTELQEEGYLDRSKRATDAWDNDFRIECEGDDIYVVSAGVDGQFDTEDDVE
ncbi:MAG: type II secretion system protein GspG [Sandaracinus sp.]|nr:type II secretion system protein GspG [Sandaracinus sp.]